MKLRPVVKKRYKKHSVLAPDNLIIYLEDKNGNGKIAGHIVLGGHLTTEEVFQVLEFLRYQDNNNV